MPQETRVFESTDNSPETVAANKAYFESEGNEVEVEGAQPESAQVETQEPTVEAHAQTEVPEVDAETEAEWKNLGNDGTKRGSFGRLKKEKRELTAALDKEKAERKRVEDELAKLQPEPAKPSQTTETQPVETFSDPEPQPPAEPQLSDFAEADDPIDALNKALVKYVKDSGKHSTDHGRWERKKEKFEDGQQQAKAQKDREAEQTRTQQQTEQQTYMQGVQAKVDKAVAVHPDLHQVVTADKVSRAVTLAALEIDGGIETVYRLAKEHPERLKVINEAVSQTHQVDGQDFPTPQAVNRAMYFIGQFEAETRSTTSSTPSSPPPVEERASAPPVRGRTVSTVRREDMSGDDRREQLRRDIEAGRV